MTVMLRALDVNDEARIIAIAAAEGRGDWQAVRRLLRDKHQADVRRDRLDAIPRSTG
jgi:hypothetical protein